MKKRVIYLGLAIFTLVAISISFFGLKRIFQSQSWKKRFD